MRHITVLFACIAITSPLAGQQSAADSLRPARTSRKLIRLPEAIGFAALAGLTFANDRSITGHFSGHRSGISNAVADLGNGLGDGVIVYPVLVLGAVAGKLAGSRGLFGVSWRALQSTALAGGAAMILKTSIGRQRPFQSPDDPYIFHPFKFKDNALPSGHTAVSFALAASLAAETKDHWSDALFFGLATLTSYGRMHYDKHWASDTVVGAGLGILSARFIHRHDRAVMLSPGAVAVSLMF